MTQCNYCTLRNIRANAKVADKEVTLRPGWNGGHDVYVHPKGVEITDGKRKGEPGEYWVAWMMALPDECRC